MAFLHEEQFNPFPHIYPFWRLCCRQLFKTLWQKQKLLKTSNFSFGHNISTLSNYLTPIHGEFSWFCQYLFKVVCCRFVACGKGLRKWSDIRFHNLKWFEFLWWLSLSQSVIINPPKQAKRAFSFNSIRVFLDAEV